MELSEIKNNKLLDMFNVPIKIMAVLSTFVSSLVFSFFFLIALIHFLEPEVNLQNFGGVLMMFVVLTIVLYSKISKSQHYKKYSDWIIFPGSLIYVVTFFGSFLFPKNIFISFLMNFFKNIETDFSTGSIDYVLVFAFFIAIVLIVSWLLTLLVNVVDKKNSKNITFLAFLFLLATIFAAYIFFPDFAKLIRSHYRVPLGWFFGLSFFYLHSSFVIKTIKNYFLEDDSNQL